MKLLGERLVTGRFSLELVRTLRVPVDGRYPLPPALGSFPIYPVRRLKSLFADYVVPIYQREAMFLRFEAAEWKPNAVQIGSGGINVLTGEKFPSRLTKHPQNYIVCPLQPWLDGFKTGSSKVNQFVAMPLGSGITAAEQLSGKTDEPSLYIRIIEPQPGIFPDKRPRGFTSLNMYQELPVSAMGLAVGGEIGQDIYSDPNPVSIWDNRNFADVRILLLNSEDFHNITGEDPPPSPVSADEYTRLGLPWFDFYDERHVDVETASRMTSLARIATADPPIHPENIRTIRRGTRKKS